MKLQHLLLDWMRILNKKVFNRVTLKFAGSSHSPISVIHHVGRRSGTNYATPVITLPLRDSFVFALPYGRNVDWYRNVQVTRRGTLIWHGKEFLVEDPELLDVRDPAELPFVLRLILPVLGTQLFRQMKSTRVHAESNSEHQKDMAFE